MNWEVKVVRVTNPFRDETEAFWNKECVDGWEPFWAYVSRDLSHITMHFKRQVKTP